MKQIMINGKWCTIAEHGIDGPVILWGMYPHPDNETEHLWDCLMETVPEKSFRLIAYQAEDWNRDFSPWEAPPAFGKEGFSGGGAATLHWLTDSCIPYIREYYGQDCPWITAGYSLAGLFALWALYESDIFSGAVSCSGSLWFPGWDSYVASRTLPGKSNVYLSLGSKEEKTRNAVMAAVGERTRAQEQILKRDKNTEHVILEWNPGGHFADSGKRLAKGIKWMLEQYENRFNG